MFGKKDSDMFKAFSEGLLTINRHGLSTKRQYKIRSKPYFIE
jgi:hypothetical protein